MEVGAILETYRVDLAHARQVADHAVALFDAVAGRYRLDPAGRRLLEVAALLHNVGLTTDPPAHHLVGRDLVLRHPIDGLDARERTLVAALVAFHRKRVRPRTEPTFLALDQRRRQEALALAALLRVADGLDYSQTQTTRLAEVAAGPAGPVLRLDGPSAGADGLRAVAKADLWAKRFGQPLAAEGPGGEPLPPPPEEAGGEEQVEAEAALLPAWYADPLVPLAELGRVLLRRHLRRLLEADRDVRADRGIEPVHELRVTTRRIRATLRLLEPVGPRELRAHGKALRRLARAAGAVRDRDVLLAHLGGAAAELPEDVGAGMAALRETLEAERREAHGRLVRAMDAVEHAEFLGAFAAAICRHSGWDNEPLVRDLGGSTIWRHYEALRSHAHGGLPAEDAALHAMRIDGKRLRYVLELFADTFGPRADGALKALAGFQEHLGALNDVAVARELLAPLAGDPACGPAAAAYLALREQRFAGLRAELPARWAQLDGEAYRRELLELIAGL
jgi:CHAD domain-containing protein